MGYSLELASTKLVEDVQQNATRETKSKYEFEGFKGQRGYTSFGKEHAKGKKEGDLKEF